MSQSMPSLSPTPRWRLEKQVELCGPPGLGVGVKVQAVVPVRNDGTFPGRAVGDVLIAPGDVGYVTAVGTFLQQFYIYSVDFYERRMVVGMRLHELQLIDATCNDPKRSDPDD